MQKRCTGLLDLHTDLCRFTVHLTYGHELWVPPEGIRSRVPNLSAFLGGNLPCREDKWTKADCWMGSPKLQPQPYWKFVDCAYNCCPRQGHSFVRHTSHQNKFQISAEIVN